MQFYSRFCLRSCSRRGSQGSDQSRGRRPEGLHSSELLDDLVFGPKAQLSTEIRDFPPDPIIVCSGVM